MPLAGALVDGNSSPCVYQRKLLEVADSPFLNLYFFFELWLLWHNAVNNFFHFFCRHHAEALGLVVMVVEAGIAIGDNGFLCASILESYGLLHLGRIDFTAVIMALLSPYGRKTTTILDAGYSSVLVILE